MAGGAYAFTGSVWEHDGPGAWHFISLPPEVADEIEEVFGRHAAGFGSIRVDVRIGATAWSTSIFPDTKRGTYVLPVKKPVRLAEGVQAGTVVGVELRVSDGAS